MSEAKKAPVENIAKAMDILEALMDAKKVLSGIKEDIQKSNSEYADIISKTKLSRVELLKTNNELQKKTEGNAEIAEEYKKQNLLTEEISNSKRELSEIKDEIKKYNSELESIRTNADNSPDFKKMREEKEKLENLTIQNVSGFEGSFGWTNIYRLTDDKGKWIGKK